MDSETISGDNEASTAAGVSIQALIQTAIKTVEDLTELDRRLVPREIVEELEAKLMVAEAKIAALQSDVEEKEAERKLYYDKFKKYGRKNRELKNKLARIQSNGHSNSPKLKKKAKKKTRSIEKPTLPDSTSPTSSKKSTTKPSNADTVPKKKRRSKSTSNANPNPTEPSFSSMSPRDNDFTINHSFSESGWSDDPPPLQSNLKIEDILNPNSVENRPSTSTANLQDPQIEPTSTQEGFSSRFCEPQLRPAPFRSIEHYRIHIKHVHFLNEQPYFCRLCPYHSAKKSDVKRHERIHSVGDHETKYICEICSVRFSNKRALGAHCNNYHNIKGYMI